MPSRLVLNQATYEVVMKEIVPAAKEFLWLVTADLKDLHVEGRRGSYIPFLQVLSERLEDGIAVRLIHAKEPGPRFRADFDRFAPFIESDLFERLLCPRMHTKCVIADGRLAYIGSANMTGAGMGAKNANRRNFEAGIFTNDVPMIRELMEFIDSFYLGDHCTSCQLREVCPDPII